MILGMNVGKWIGYGVLSITLIPMLFNNMGLRIFSFFCSMTYLYYIVKNIEYITDIPTPRKSGVNGAK